MTGGHVYTWGDGASGKLGHQDNNNKKLPTKISALREKKVPANRPACGFDHILMVTASAEYGEVGKEFGVTISGGLPMAMGANDAGQLDLGAQSGRPQWTPQMLDPKLRSNVEGSVDAKAGSNMFPGPVTMLAAGQSFSLALAAGTVWSWGTGNAGQLGVPKPPDDPKRPSFIPQRIHCHLPAHITTLRSVKYIAAGQQFAVALCDNSSVFAWGANDKGQLGLGDEKERPEPVKVEALEDKKVSQVALGQSHALALIEGGKVMAWGSAQGGQLGTGATKNTNSPEEVSGLSDMQSIAAAGNVSWAWRNLCAAPAKKRKAEAAAAGADEPTTKKRAPKKKK